MFPVARPTLIFGPDPKSFFKIFLFLSIFLHYICMLLSVKKCKICSNYLFFVYSTQQYIQLSAFEQVPKPSSQKTRLARCQTWTTFVRQSQIALDSTVACHRFFYWILKYVNIILDIYDFIIFNCLYFSKLIINIVCVDFLRDLLNIASIDKRRVLNHRNIFTAKCSPALYVINYANIEYCNFCNINCSVKLEPIYRDGSIHNRGR